MEKKKNYTIKARKEKPAYNHTNYKYFITYKPYDMLSQFTEEDGHKGLGTLQKFPRDVYPVGRLDADSEGLLILTNDKRIVSFINNPESKMTKTYLAQVEGIPSDASLAKFKRGLDLNFNGKPYKTAPAQVSIVKNPTIPERNPPVNYSKSPTHCWLEIKLTEGKNRQVRKMTAAIGHPTLRLIRTAVHNLSLELYEPGLVIEMKEKDFLIYVGYTKTVKNIAQAEKSNSKEAKPKGKRK